MHENMSENLEAKIDSCRPVVNSSLRRPLRELQIRAPHGEDEIKQRRSRWAADIDFRLQLWEKENEKMEETAIHHQPAIHPCKGSNSCPTGCEKMEAPRRMIGSKDREAAIHHGKESNSCPTPLVNEKMDVMSDRKPVEDRWMDKKMEETGWIATENGRWMDEKMDENWMIEMEEPVFSGVQPRSTRSTRMRETTDGENRRRESMKIARTARTNPSDGRTMRSSDGGEERKALKMEILPSKFQEEGLMEKPRLEQKLKEPLEELMEVELDEWPTPPDSPLLQRCAEPVVDIFSFAKDSDAPPPSPNLEDPPVEVHHEGPQKEDPAVVEAPSGFHDLHDLHDMQSPTRGFLHHLHSKERELVLSQVRGHHGEALTRDDQRKLPKKESPPRSEVRSPDFAGQLSKSPDHDQHDQPDELSINDLLHHDPPDLRAPDLADDPLDLPDVQDQLPVHADDPLPDFQADPLLAAPQVPHVHFAAHPLAAPLADATCGATCVAPPFSDTESTIDLQSEALLPSFSSPEAVPQRQLLPQRTLEALPSWNFDTLRGYFNSFQRSKLRQQQREQQLEQLQLRLQRAQQKNQQLISGVSRSKSMGALGPRSPGMPLCAGPVRAHATALAVHSRCQLWMEERQKRQFLRREEVRKEELKECTFHPQRARESPRPGVSHGGAGSVAKSCGATKVSTPRVALAVDNDVPLYDRQMRWRQRLDEKFDEQRQQRQQQQLQLEAKHRPSPRSPREVEEAFERFHQRSRQWQRNVRRCRSVAVATPRSKDVAKAPSKRTTCQRARSEERHRDTPRSNADRVEVSQHLKALRRALFDDLKAQQSTGTPQWQKALQVEVARSQGAGAAPFEVRSRAGPR